MIYQLLGFGLLLVSYAHLFTGVNRWETQIVRKVQGLFKNKPWLTVFQEIWFFGRTSFAVISLLLLISLKMENRGNCLTGFPDYSRYRKYFKKYP